MLTYRKMTTLAALALLVNVSGPVSAQGSGERKVQAFMIPHDRESVQMTTQIGGHIERALSNTDRLELVDLAEVLGGQPTDEFKAARQEARSALRAGRNHYNQVRFSEAIEALEKAVELHRDNASWIDRMPEYSNCLAYLAASYVLSGQGERGRETFKELLLHDGGYELDESRFDPSLQEIVEQVKNEIESGSVGSISVSSNPPGARVFVSGEQRGFTPASIDRIPTGRHILRLEQMGTMPHGEVIEVTATEDRTYDIELRPTDEFERIQAVVNEIGDEINAGRVGSAMIRLGRYVNLDWAVYGVVQRTFGSVKINAWIVSIPNERRIATRRFELPTTEFNMESEVRKAVASLVEDARRRDRRASSSTSRSDSDDPLSGRSGTEGWFRDRDEAGERRSLDAGEEDGRRGRRGRSGHDPLDGRTGTEDW